MVTGFEIRSDDGKTGNDVLPSTLSKSTLTRNEEGDDNNKIPSSSKNSIKFSKKGGNITWKGQKGFEGFSDETFETIIEDAKIKALFYAGLPSCNCLVLIPTLSKALNQRY